MQKPMPRMVSPRKLGIFVAVCLLVLVTGESALWACPTCTDSMANDPAQAGLVRGLFWSILFLLSMPFLITAGMGTYFYWQVRQARKKAAQEAARVTTPENLSPSAV